jgi:hypothetical protein
MLWALKSWGRAMSELQTHENRSDRSDQSDLFGIVELFRSDPLPRKSGRSGQTPRPAPAGPTGPTGEIPGRTKITEQNQTGPTGPTCPTENEGTEAENPHGFTAQYAREARPVSDESEAFPYGTACNLGDTPRTWNGHVVSLAKWHRLSEWEKHGPNGRLWCGCCRAWLPRETALSHAGKALRNRKNAWCAR